ncbi:MAG: helix-turn-helix domain-containing protein [Victivallaceae bacterium]|nr:helix-turn-helix domain-containing protein [Victivallaceae bacterium]
MTNFKKMLKQKKMKAKDVAAVIGVRPNSVSHHATSGVKTIRIAKRYAAVLNCDPLELLD